MKLTNPALSPLRGVLRQAQEERSAGFTIFEMLLAVGLSCVLLYGLMHVYLTVTRHIDFMRQTTTIQRGVALAFYQLRTDVSSAFIPETFFSDETSEGKQKKKAEDELPKEKKDALEKVAYQPYFLFSFDDRLDAAKIEGERRYPLKQLSFVTTNPLHVYEQKQPRLVRVVYELEKNKKLTKRDRDVFSLVRKEVTDIADAQAKGTESAAAQRYVVADNLRGVFLSAEILKKDVPRKKDEQEKEIPEGEALSSLSWGDRETFQGIVPRSVTMWLLFWQGETAKSVQFSETITIASYPSKRVKLEDLDKPEPAPQQPGQPAQPAPAEQPNGVAMVKLQGATP